MATANTLSAEMQRQLKRFEFVLGKAKPALLYAVQLHKLSELAQSVNDYRRLVVYKDCDEDDLAIVLKPISQDFGWFDEDGGSDPMILKKRSIVLSRFGDLLIIEKLFSQIGTSMEQEFYSFSVCKIDLDSLARLAQEPDSVAHLITALRVLLQRECAKHRQHEATIVHSLYEGEIGLLDRDLFDAGELTGFK